MRIPALSHTHLTGCLLHIDRGGQGAHLLVGGHHHEQPPRQTEHEGNGVMIIFPIRMQVPEHSNRFNFWTVELIDTTVRMYRLGLEVAGCLAVCVEDITTSQSDRRKISSSSMGP